MHTAATAPGAHLRGATARLAIPATAFAALLVGGLAALEPALAVAAVVALALVPIVLARPIVGLGALVFMSFLESYSGMTGAVSLTKILGGVLVLAWLTVVALSASAADRRGFVRREPLLAAAILVFVGWTAMSLAWASVPELAQTSLQRFALNFTLFPIALVALRTRRHVLWLVVLFIAGAITASAMGISAGTIGAEETEGRLKGAGLNPNQLGSYLVVSMVLATALAANVRWSALTRMVAVAGAAFAAIGVFLTLSRGALVGMAAALLVAPLVVGRRRRGRSFVLVAVVIGGTVGWFGAIAPASAVERVTHPDRGGGSGREDLWRVGWRMVQDKPLQGVGAGNFPEESVNYLLRPGATQRDAFIVDEKKVAHNIYLTVASELGVVGLSLFLVIVAACLRSGLRAARTFAASGDALMELISRALVISIVSLLAVGFFSSALYVKQFWILLAAAPAFHAVAERQRRADLSLARPPLRPVA